MDAGKIYQFKVKRQTDIGFILEKGKEEIFLHANDCENQVLHPDDIVDAFVFYDSKKRLTATLGTPKITIENYEFCEVVNQIKSGVFVSIGIRKDFLVSNDKLPDDKNLWPKNGDKLLVTLKEQRNALVALMATRPILKEFSIPAPTELKMQDFEAIVVKINYAGINILTVEGYFGFIHKENMRDMPRLGETISGKVIEVLNNGEIVGNIIPRKETVISDDALLILKYLEDNKGVMHFTDKSDPEAIKDTFHLSKAAFKRAIGFLLKNKLIKQDIQQNKIEKI